MNKFSAAISDEEARAAAEYFAAMQPLADWFDVVETDTVERSFIGKNRLRSRYPDGGTEPLGQRIVMLPKNEDLARYKDPRSNTTIDNNSRSCQNAYSSVARMFVF